MNFPTLYKRDSRGNVQTWFISVLDEKSPIIVTKHGKMSGKIQCMHESIEKGKNIGKINETSPLEQAKAEAISKWTKQIERKGYVQNIDDIDKDLRPGAECMLAHRYDKYVNKIQFPCYIQPKLDGHRCIAVICNGSAKLYSRQRKQITGLPNIEQALIKHFGKSANYILDGELYNHEYKQEFEKLTGFIRSEESKEGHEVVQYHIYDVIMDKPYEQRLAKLKDMFFLYTGTTLKPVPTINIADSEGVMNVFRFYINSGYEGAILRNKTGLYVGKRSYDLQKVKQFDDAEFEVVDITEGRGKMAGHAIFTCETADKTQFEVKMKGSMGRLKEIYQNPDQYIGKMLTVQFQGYTSTNKVPRFPVALRFRDNT